MTVGVGYKVTSKAMRVQYGSPEPIKFRVEAQEPDNYFSSVAVSMTEDEARQLIRELEDALADRS